MPPLKWPDRELLTESFAEKLCMFVPILGWCVGYDLQCRRMGKAICQVSAQLAARSEFPESAWGRDPERVALARQVCRIIKEALEWPNDHFLPDDPFELVCLDEEGMGWAEVGYELEDRLGVRLTLDEDVRFLSMTLGEVVDGLREHVHRPEHRS